MPSGIRKEILAVLTDAELLAIRNAHFRRLEAVLEGRDDGDRVFGTFGCGVEVGIEPGEEPAEVAIQAMEAAAEHADGARDREMFRPIYVSIGMGGVSFVDRIFEPELASLADWQARYLDAPVGELRDPDLERSDHWQRATALTLALVDTGASLPIIGTPCLSSALNVAINLYGQAFLLAMAMNPDAARRDLDLINEVLKVLHTWFLQNVPVQQLGVVALSVRTMPPGYGHIDGCSTHLISGEMYTRLVADLDEAILSLYSKGGMIHLCGTHTQHMAAWREMAPLKVIQLAWPAEEDLATYYAGLRDDQYFYAGPCSSMSLDRVLEATAGGQRLVIPADFEPPLPLRGPSRRTKQRQAAMRDR